MNIIQVESNIDKFFQTYYPNLKLPSHKNYMINLCNELIHSRGRYFNPNGFIVKIDKYEGKNHLFVTYEDEFLPNPAKVCDTIFIKMP